MTPREQIEAALKKGDREALDAIRKKCLEPTKEGLSFLARGVLGQDYFKVYEDSSTNRKGMDWNGEFREGCGLVDWGPHGQMCDFLARPPSAGKVKLIQPRGPQDHSPPGEGRPGDPSQPRHPHHHPDVDRRAGARLAARHQGTA